METIYRHRECTESFLVTISGGVGTSVPEENVYVQCKEGKYLVGRPDRLSDDEIVECKDAPKWKHALGQLVAYREALRIAGMNGRKCVLELYMSKPSDSKYIAMATRIGDELGITIRAIQCVRINWRFYISIKVWKGYIKAIYSYTGDIRGDAVYGLAFSFTTSTIGELDMRTCIENINTKHDTKYTYCTDTLCMFDKESWGMNIDQCIDIPTLYMKYTSGKIVDSVNGTTLSLMELIHAPNIGVHDVKQTMVRTSTITPDEVSKVAMYGATIGDIDIVKWSVERGACSWDTLLYIAGKHQNIITYLKRTRTKQNTSGKHLQDVLRNQSSSMDDIRSALKSTNVPVSNTRIITEIASLAARRGSFDVVKWAIEHGARNWSSIVNEVDKGRTYTVHTEQYDRILSYVAHVSK